MGVVKKSKSKSKEEVKNELKNKKVVNGKKNVDKNGKVKKKKTVSCLQCIKSHDDGGLEGKYRVAAPELMQDTFMSDSEDEGGEVECPIQQQQQYRYMNSEAGTLHRAKPLEDSVTDGHLWPSNNDRKVATIERQPLDQGFLVSFVVDARGGAMKAKRRGGVRVIVPPAACAAPTRVTCRAATRRAPAAAPPPLMEGEALASRLLELQPQGAKFLAPVIIEVPIYTASCKEREIVILRSDTGETWQDHYLHNNDNPMIQEALLRERQEHGPTGETLGENGERVCRIVTCDFPHYLACVSRVRQEVHIIGPEGGTVSSAHTPQVQALFPPQALTKRIRVGIQAHSAAPELSRRVLPRHVSVSPVITVEPRRRKFHRSITLTAPLPSQDGKPDKNTATLRLLCSIMGGQARAVWEDVTGSTPLTVTEDCASFTTTVSARFWLINCQNVSDASKLATELYREMLLVPFNVRIVVLAKRLDALEGRLLVLYITDRYAYDTLLQQEHYAEVAHSTAVRFLDGKEIYLEFSGNLVPVTKSGSQPVFNFESFKDNRVEFTVRVKHHEEPPSGRIYFMNEPKVPKGEQSQTPACVLDVELPDRVAPRAGKSHTDYLNLDQSGFDALKDELSFHYGEHPSLTPHPPPPVPPPVPPPGGAPALNGHDKIITNGDVKYTTKEEEKDEKEDLPPKPHVNGGAVVDSNKTKATFDSDEDKTPHNTLEKGDKTKKEKREGGFFGGIADKVKHVFSHSEDREDDSKESSPKAKGRESKEKSPTPRKEKSPPPRKEKSPPPHKGKEGKDKSPPKAAPRIIDEGLLDKVDDMFKDLKTKPHREDDDIESKVYATKLVVDEDIPHLDTHLDTKEVYEQYANMQPVDTPLSVPIKDPFAYDTDEKLCCKGYKGGQKHTHDETSNLVDRIENANFTAQEKLAEVSGKIEGDVKDGIEKLDKEKDYIKQKAGEVADDLKNKEQELKSNAQDKLQELKEAAKETADNLKESLGVVRDNVEHKAQVIDFLAQEKAEAAKLNTGQAVAAAKNAAQEIKKDAKNAAQEIKKDANNAAQEIKKDAKNAAENAKSVANEKLHDLSESVESAKGKAQEAVNDAKSKAKEVKEEVKSKKEKKKKEGKNFISGFVSNIFGEKDKAEKAVKDKYAESKDAANDLLDQAAAKKDDIEYSAAKKQHELQQQVDQLVNSADAKKKELKKAAHDKAAEAQKSIQDKADEAKKAAQEKVDEAKQAATDAKQAVEDKANETKQAALDAKQALEDKAKETKQALQDTAEEAKQAVQDKKNEAEKAVHKKAEEVKQAAQEKADRAASEIQSKKDKLEHAVNEKTEEAKGALQATKEGLVDFGHAVQDKAHETKQAVADKTDEAKKAVQDKASDLKVGADNLVQGAKSKTEEVGQAIHDKAHDVKESLKEKKGELADGAKNLLDQAAAKKNEVQEGISKKHEELKEGAESLVHGAQAKVGEAGEAIHNKKEDIAQGIHDKTFEISNAFSEKKDEFGRAIHDKKDEAASELERIRLEAEQTTQQISKSAEDAINAAADKKSELQANLGHKVEDIKKSGKEGLENLQQSASGKVDSLQKQSKEAFAHMQDSALGSFDKVESAAKDKVSDATDKWEDLQSSTRDTFADFKDDAKSWENSAQDTLHSFQSSAGNTFDSLDDSAREFIGGAQNTAQSVENSSQELFGEVNKGFEGFQVSADNKLEDVKGATNERLEEAGARLSETAEGVAKNAQETEHAVLDAVSAETDKFTSSLNDLGNSVFGSSGKGFMKDSSTKLLESEKSQASPSPQKKGSGIPKLKKKGRK